MIKYHPVLSEDDAKMFNVEPEDWERKQNKVEIIRMACLLNANKCVEKLLVLKADPNNCDSYGLTPLHHASMNDNAELVKLLVQNGGNINTETDNVAISRLVHACGGRTPLLVAAEVAQ